MSKVLIVLICYLFAFNFIAKAGNESEIDDENPNPELFNPLVLIVENANFDKVFNVTPDVARGVPFITTKIQDTDVYSNDLPLNEHKFYLCPQPTLKDILGQAGNYPTNIQGCLFVTRFEPDEPKKCAELPNGATVANDKIPNSVIRYGRQAVKLCYPVFKKHKTTEGYRGGIRNFLAKQSSISEVVIKRNYLTLYNFVYNEEEERTEYTIQTVKPMSTSWSFTKQPDEVYRSGDELLKNSFRLLIKAYDAQDKTEPYVLAHRLAQPTQYPFKIMTVGTSAIINTAPLQKKLEPLVYLIEERIQRLSDHISRPLKIMTKTLYHQIDQQVEELYLDENRKFLIPNVWSKQVYDETTNSGIVIIVHNYLDYVPSEGLLCKKKASCQFRKWKTESSQFEDAFDESLIKFAYCCKEAKFSMMANVNIGEVIDINFDFQY